MAIVRVPSHIRPVDRVGLVDNRSINRDMARAASEEIAVIRIEDVTPALNHETWHAAMYERSIVVTAIYKIQEICDRLRRLRIKQFDIDASQVGLHAQERIGND